MQEAIRLTPEELRKQQQEIDERRKHTAKGWRKRQVQQKQVNKVKVEDEFND